MKKGLTRRQFLKTAAAGAVSILGGVRPGLWPPGPAWAAAPDVLSVASGADYYAAAVKAVEQLGGMDRFVPQGSTVGLLANIAFRLHGSLVCPDVLLAVAAMCERAGARRIVLLKGPSSGRYWKGSSRYDQHQDLIVGLTISDREFKSLDIPDGSVLKNALVARDLLACDVFINVPIIKHHKGVHLTGALKNMMGLCPYDPTLKYFHNGTGKPGWYGDVDHLSQCIADLNLLRRPDLIVTDATEFISSNGPWGPGKLIKARRVLAGRDPVSVDAYGGRLLGREAKDIPTLDKARQHGLGQTDLKKITILETGV